MGICRRRRRRRRRRLGEGVSMRGEAGELFRLSVCRLSLFVFCARVFFCAVVGVLVLRF